MSQIFTLFLSYQYVATIIYVPRGQRERDQLHSLDINVAIKIRDNGSHFVLHTCHTVQYITQGGGT